MLSTPASIAFMFVKLDIPVVAWVCKCIGIEIALFSAETNSKAYSGLKIPDISFIQSESQSISWISFAKLTQFSNVWTGLIVKAIVPCACFSFFFTSWTLCLIFLRSFKASNILKISIPLETDFSINLETISSL